MFAFYKKRRINVLPMLPKQEHHAQGLNKGWPRNDDTPIFDTVAKTKGTPALPKQ
jgi:hypothetical protein